MSSPAPGRPCGDCDGAVTCHDCKNHKYKMAWDNLGECIALLDKSSTVAGVVDALMRVVGKTYGVQRDREGE